LQVLTAAMLKTCKSSNWLWKNTESWFYAC